MRKKIKIVTIGGGSSYTPELIEGFIKRYDELPISEIWLVDIDEGAEKLAIVGNLAKRMVEHAGVPIDIHLSLDRKEALKDADFVTTQFRVGQLDARILDERIPGKYGMLGQETNGAGGLFKALRTVPVIFDIIKDVQNLCPKAWIINFTNPVGVVAEAVFKYTDFKRFIGVCNVPINQQLHFSKILKCDLADVLPYFAGLNHMSYVLHVFKKGDKEDKLPYIIDQIGQKQMTMTNIDAGEWKYEFIKSLGVYPNPYHKYFYLYDIMFDHYMEQYNAGKTRAETVKEVEKSLFEKYRDTNLYVKPKELEKRGGALYSDVACSVISAIYNDSGEYHGVNTRNGGCISGINEKSAVEVTCKITKNGPEPLAIGALPPQINGTVHDLKAYEELLAEAIYEKDLKKALLALQIHPFTTNVNTAEMVFNELLIAHQKYLKYYQKKEEN